MQESKIIQNLDNFDSREVRKEPRKQNIRVSQTFLFLETRTGAQYLFFQLAAKLKHAIFI